MKKTIMFISLITMLVVRAQLPSSLFYKLKASFPLKECDSNGNVLNIIDSVKLVPGGSKFTINETKGDYYVIRLWHWYVPDSIIQQISEKAKLIKDKLNFLSVLPEQKKKWLEQNTYKWLTFNYRINDQGNLDQRYFLIKKDNLANQANELKQTVTPVMGAATLPFKWRHQTGDFNKDITLSGLGGISLNSNRVQDFHLNVLVGIGISSVTLDSSNTEGKVKESMEGSAITIPFGIVAEWKKAQIGVFTGWDFISNRNSNNWIYHRKNWISIGIGYSIFSPSSPIEEKNQ
jgi:hypothetical protein